LLANSLKELVMQILKQRELTLQQFRASPLRPIKQPMLPLPQLLAQLA
jgi:hypothetical protein